jgi:N6-adenosine-specific RNA methylase IME4
MRARCWNCHRRFDADRPDRLTCSDTCRRAWGRYLAAMTPPLPSGPFDLVYADPPMHFQNWSDTRQWRTPTYWTLPVQTICRLPVREIVARHATLVVWAYNPLLFEMDKIAAAWGFPDFGGVLFTWVKRTTHDKLEFGQGHTTRKGSEQCLLFTRGNGLRRHDKGVREVFEEAIDAKLGEPHEKPEIFAKRLEQLYGDVRRIELYARRHRPGWTPWGNQVGLLDQAAS